MALSVSNNPTQLSSCDATTSWTGGDRTPLVDTGVKVEGSGSLSDWVNLKLQTAAVYTFTSTDMSNGEHIYIWMYCSGVVDTQANGGYRITASDGTNSSTWYVGGNDTHEVKWNLMACSVDATPDASSGTLNTAAVTSISIQFKTLTAAIKKGQTYINNVYWDNLQYGKGLTITSATGDDIEYEDIYAVDSNSSNMYGVIQKSYGSYIESGTLTFGGTGTETVDMLIDNAIIVFPSNTYVGSDFYKLLVLGNATGSTVFEVTNSVIKSDGLEKFIFDSSSANIDTLTIKGTSFLNANTIDFASGQTISGTVFTACNEIDTNGATFTNCTINNTTAATSTGALLVNSSTELASISYITFNEYTSKYAVYIPASVTGAITFTGFIGDASGTDVYWAATTGTLTINKAGGTNFSTWDSAGTGTSGNGDVLIVSSVDIAINVKNQAGANIVGALVYVDEDLETAGNIANTTTDANGDVDTSYSGGASTATVRVRKYGFKPYVGTISLASNSSTNVVLITDPQQT